MTKDYEEYYLKLQNGFLGEKDVFEEQFMTEFDRLQKCYISAKLDHHIKESQNENIKDVKIQEM